MNKLLMLLGLTSVTLGVWGVKPPSTERSDPTEYVVFSDYPSPYDTEPIDLEAHVWKPAGDGPFPVVIMVHGSGGLYHLSDDRCDDNDRDCWVIFEKFKYWGKQLSVGHKYVNKDKFLVIAPDSYTPRGYDHSGLVNINPSDRPANVNSYLGRPWDLYAVIRYLESRDDVDMNSIFALGFSSGGGTILNAVAASDEAVMVDQSDWFDGINNADPLGWLEMQNIGLKAAMVYYPSCGFFGHFSNNYWNYAPVLVQTGLNDEVTPVSSCEDRRSEALSFGVLPEHFVVNAYVGMDHSFDYQQYDSQAACEAAKHTIAFFSQHLGDELFVEGFENPPCINHAVNR